MWVPRPIFAPVSTVDVGCASKPASARGTRRRWFGLTVSCQRPLGRFQNAQDSQSAFTVRQRLSSGFNAHHEFFAFNSKGFYLVQWYGFGVRLARNRYLTADPVYGMRIKNKLLVPGL